MRHDHARVMVAKASECRTVAASGRAAEHDDRSCCLTSDQRDSVRALARTMCLRSLVADYGVSYKIVRRVLHEAEAAIAWRSRRCGGGDPGSARAPVRAAAAAHPWSTPTARSSTQQ